MSLKFTESFRVARGATQLLRKGWATASGDVSTIGVGYQGSRAIRSSTVDLISPTFTEQDQWVFGFAFGWYSVGTGVPTPKITFRRDSGSEQVHLLFRKDTDDLHVYYIDLKRDTTVITTFGPYFVDGWDSVSYFEFKCKFDPVTGTYELKRNGVSEGSDTGVNTAYTAVAGMDSIRIQGNYDTGSAQTLWGDLVLTDDQGALNNDYLGPVRVLGIRPTSDGAATDWELSTGSDHFALIDDPDGTPNDTDRIISFTSADTDLFGYGDLGVPAACVIYGVLLSTVARMDASGTQTVGVRYREAGASTSDGTTQAVSSATWVGWNHIWEQDPIAVSAWTVALVDAAQFGVYVV